MQRRYLTMMRCLPDAGPGLILGVFEAFWQHLQKYLLDSMIAILRGDSGAGDACGVCKIVVFVMRQGKIQGWILVWIWGGEIEQLIVLAENTPPPGIFNHPRGQQLKKLGIMRVFGYENFC